MDTMDIKNMIHFYEGLRSYRKFQQKKIPEEILHGIIECVRLAPSGSNRQKLRFVVVESDEKLKELQPLVNYSAALPKEVRTPKKNEQPVAFIVIVKEPGPDMNLQMDAGISAEAIVTAAWSQGIGCVMMGNIQYKEIAKVLGVGEKDVVLAIAMGYPAIESHVVPIPEDGKTSYYLDNDGNYCVPKYSVEQLAKFI